MDDPTEEIADGDGSHLENGGPSVAEQADFNQGFMLITGKNHLPRYPPTISLIEESEYNSANQKIDVRSQKDTKHTKNASSYHSIIPKPKSPQNHISAADHESANDLENLTLDKVENESPDRLETVPPDVVPDANDNDVLNTKTNDTPGENPNELSEDLPPLSETNVVYNDEYIFDGNDLPEDVTHLKTEKEHVDGFDEAINKDESHSAKDINLTEQIQADINEHMNSVNDELRIETSNSTEGAKTADANDAQIGESVIEMVQDAGIDNEDLERGKFLCWGSGEFYQHCHKNEKDVGGHDGIVEQFSSKYGSRIRLVSCGSSHSIVVTNGGDIYVWGNGNSGQLGCGDTRPREKPEKVRLYSKKSKNTPQVCQVACGGRHTFIVMENGHMFSFGNNFYAQLGYDFRIKKYKSNQVKPMLLETLTYRPVRQVACGEKHTLILFKDGAVATLGNNAFGQIGTGDREEAVVPKILDELREIKHIATGANHNIIVDDLGTVFVWGSGKGCGSKAKDILEPEELIWPNKRRNIIAVAAGQSHSMALTGNGNVYTWGSGVEGQLGQGHRVKFLMRPRMISCQELRHCVTHIACGDMYSAAVTEAGHLYMWGKNSHTINAARPTSEKYFSPVLVNLGSHLVSHVSCGAWHAAAITGKPVWEKLNTDSDSDQDETIQPVPPELSSDRRILTSDQKSTSPDQWETCSELTADTESDVALPEGLQREKTTMTLAEFYAPTPQCESRLQTGIPKTPDFIPKTPMIREESKTYEHDEDVRDATQVLVVTHAPVPESPELEPHIQEEETEYDRQDKQVGDTIDAEKPRSKVSFENPAENVPKPALVNTDAPNAPTVHVPAWGFQRSKTFMSNPSAIKQMSETLADKFSVPKEKTMIGGNFKNIDFLSVESIMGNKLPSGPNSGPFDTSKKSGGPKAGRTKLRRPQKSNMLNKAPDIDGSINRPALMRSRTHGPSMVASEASSTWSKNASDPSNRKSGSKSTGSSPFQLRRQVTIPPKHAQPKLQLPAKRYSKPMYSSGTSWREKKDRNILGSAPLSKQSIQHPAKDSNVTSAPILGRTDTTKTKELGAIDGMAVKKQGAEVT
ncbi:unnamed protein product [Owenia fusiformis]|uniref:RCC1-like domain-containing protein n=1 Tax=Owenia fusiformis TaxID=6347 RepID=A0A8J1XTI9_OWEFU|nr:unnamed protein product [Owenia fusiformis]